MVVWENVVGLKVELDSAGDKGFQDLEHRAEKGDRTVIRVGNGTQLLGKDNSERTFPSLGKVTRGEA